MRVLCRCWEMKLARLDVAGGAPVLGAGVAGRVGESGLGRQSCVSGHLGGHSIQEGPRRQGSAVALSTAGGAHVLPLDITRSGFTSVTSWGWVLSSWVAGSLAAHMAHLGQAGHGAHWLLSVFRGAEDSGA